MFLPGTPAQAGEPFKPGCAGGLSTGRPARQRRGRAGGQYPRLHSRSPRQQQGMGPRAAGLPCWRSHRLLDPEGGGLPVAVRRPGGVQAAAPREHRAAAASLLQAAAYGLRASGLPAISGQGCGAERRSISGDPEGVGEKYSVVSPRNIPGRCCSLGPTTAKSWGKSTPGQGDGVRDFEGGKASVGALGGRHGQAHAPHQGDAEC